MIRLQAQANAGMIAGQCLRAFADKIFIAVIIGKAVIIAVIFRASYLNNKNITAAFKANARRIGHIKVNIQTNGISYWRVDIVVVIIANSYHPV